MENTTNKKLIPFVHLHVHSQYSLLDGQASIDMIVEKAVKDGMKAIALTDHGAMFGIKEFYNKIQRQNAPIYKQIKELEEKIEKEHDKDKLQALNEKLTALKQKLFKPIIGCECYCARRNRFLKDKDHKEDLSGYHLIVLAKNLHGYKNLIKIVSLSWTEGHYGRPRIDKDLLEKYHDGLIVSTACLGGEVPQLIMKNKIAEAEKTIEWFKRIFGEDYYLELQRHETYDPNANQTTFPKQQKVNKVILELSKKHNVKVIATNDVHFANEEDAEAHDRLICLSTGKDLNDPNRMRYSKQEWLKTTAEMNAIFSDIPEALFNTNEIAEKVEFYSIDHKALMPDYPIPKEFKDDDEYLHYLTYKGAEERYGKNLTDEIKERIDFELETIKNMGFPGYFLIVQDFISAAREMNVSVGPGRGSAAGSAVAYCLKITDIDPIKYDLLFERFLNPDRISMPDIDVDFDDDGRSDVLHWVTEKYGQEKVAHIITYGTMATKSALRDVARVEGMTPSEINIMAKLIPDKIPGEKKLNLEKAINYVPELKKAANGNDKRKRAILKYAQMLEGNVRNRGVHACGIIIGKTDISDIVPVCTATDKDSKEEILVTQYEGKVIEETGLIKMDFLGLKTLSIIREALELIEQTRGIKIDIDKISIEDKKTYKLYSEGKTTGTFQFESAGMQKYLKALQPSKFEDLIAMNALYRPGPMEYIPSFIARKHGKEKITYDIPIMERYLKDTYGITVYQEQVMLLSRLLANFTRGQSDELRKAMGKKLIDKMAVLKEKFLSGGMKNGYESNTLEKIWGDWEKFASYAFNKSHATCYSWVAYQTAYLKANFPSEYMAAVLSRNINDLTEITKFMDECRNMGIQVLGPDINESMRKFSVDKQGNIRFGLLAVKGVAESAVQNIIEERKNGLFKNIYDFVERINFSACNRKSFEAMALAGVFDSLGSIEREQFFVETENGVPFIDLLMRYGSKFQLDKKNAQNSLFGFNSESFISKPDFPKAQPWSDLERLDKERELVGIYLSAHPLDRYRMVLDYVCNTEISDLRDQSAYEELKGKELIFAGVVTKFEERMTRNQKPFGTMELEDFSGSARINLFGQDFIDFGKYCRPGLFLFIKATIEPRPWDPTTYELKLKSIELLDEAQKNSIKNIQITLPIKEISKIFIDELSKEIKNNPGSGLLYFNIIDGEHNINVNLFSQSTRVDIASKLVDFLKENETIDFKINV